MNRHNSAAFQDIFYTKFGTEMVSRDGPDVKFHFRQNPRSRLAAMLNIIKWPCLCYCPANAINAMFCHCFRLAWAYQKWNGRFNGETFTFKNPRQLPSSILGTQGCHDIATILCYIWLYRSIIMHPKVLSKPDNKTANINAKTVVLNTLLTMTLVSDVEKSKN